MCWGVSRDAVRWLCLRNMVLIVICWRVKNAWRMARVMLDIAGVLLAGWMVGCRWLAGWLAVWLVGWLAAGYILPDAIGGGRLQDGRFRK